MKAIYLILILSIISCSKTYTPSSTPTNPNPILDIDNTKSYNSSVDANNAFALDVHRLLASSDKESNVFSSPYSIYMAISMLWNGADGNSASELKTTLRTDNQLDANNDECYNSIKSLPTLDPKVTVKIANSIWIRDGFLVISDFIEVLKSKFGAVAKNAPFDDNTVKEVNKWCGDNTNQKIPSIIDKFNGDEVMVLINAVYFNAPWKEKFEKEYTKKENFTLLDGSTKQVDMMNNTNLPIMYKNETEYVTALLNYGKEYKYDLTIIMPKDISKFNSFESSLNKEKYDEVTSNLRHVNANLKLPKQKVEFNATLNETLKKMGMKDLFSSSANLSKINKTAQLEVGKVIHKTYLKWDEEGTEAAAVTAITMVVTSMPEFVDLSIDKPFIYTITERGTNKILFIGRTVSP